MRTGLALLILLVSVHPASGQKQINSSSPLTGKSFPATLNKILLKPAEADWRKIP